MTTFNDLAGQQVKSAMEKYHKRYDNNSYIKATEGLGVQYANKLIDDCMALCGHPNYKLSHIKWSQDAIEHLKLFNTVSLVELETVEFSLWKHLADEFPIAGDNIQFITTSQNRYIGMRTNWSLWRPLIPKTDIHFNDVDIVCWKYCLNHGIVALKSKMFDACPVFLESPKG